MYNFKDYSNVVIIRFAEFIEPVHVLGIIIIVNQYIDGKSISKVSHIQGAMQFLLMVGKIVI